MSIQRLRAFGWQTIFCPALSMFVGLPMASNTLWPMIIEVTDSPRWPWLFECSFHNYSIPLWISIQQKHHPGSTIDYSLTTVRLVSLKTKTAQMALKYFVDGIRYSSNLNAKCAKGWVQSSPLLTKGTGILQNRGDPLYPVRACQRERNGISKHLKGNTELANTLLASRRSSCKLSGCVSGFGF